MTGCISRLKGTVKCPAQTFLKYQNTVDKRTSGIRRKEKLGHIKRWGVRIISDFSTVRLEVRRPFWRKSIFHIWSTVKCKDMLEEMLRLEEWKPFFFFFKPHVHLLLGMYWVCTILTWKENVNAWDTGYKWSNTGEVPGMMEEVLASEPKCESSQSSKWNS